MTMRFPEYMRQLLLQLEDVSGNYADGDWYLENAMDADDVYEMAEGIQTLVGIFREYDFI